MTSPNVVRDLEGKIALVTGATSGIGKAAAVQLAAQGAAVIVHGRDASRGAEVVAEIEKGGGSARFVGADLGVPAEALRLAQEVGDVDILVNNAGFAWFGPSEGPPPSVSPTAPPTAPPKPHWPPWPAPGPPNTDPPASGSTPSHQDPSTPMRPHGNCSIPWPRPLCSAGLPNRRRSPTSSDSWLPHARPTSPAPTWPSTPVALPAQIRNERIWHH